MNFRTTTSIVLAAAVQLFAQRHAALATPPSITTQPRDQAICDSVSDFSGAAYFHCGASGTSPLTYQWRRGTTNLANGGNIAGATSVQLQIWPGRPSDAAPDYNCVVTNTQGSAVTHNASLTVWPTGTGDVNGDGAINGLDIQAFVNECFLAFQFGSIPASFCAADMDGNGVLKCEDVCVFAQLLLQSPLGCGVAPENDDCPNATLISTGVQYNGSTAYATRDGPHITCEGSGSCSPLCSTAPDVWYKWVADFTGPADFNMCDFSQYDTVLAIYDGCPSMGGVELACNDDGICEAQRGILSRICGFQVNAGQTYWICVSGWGSEKGCFTFRVNPAAGC